MAPAGFDCVHRLAGFFSAGRDFTLLDDMTVVRKAALHLKEGDEIAYKIKENRVIVAKRARDPSVIHL